MQTSQQSDKGNKLGLGCLILFALPFAGTGVFTAVMAGRKAAAGNTREAAMLGLFALVFCVVGFGLILGGWLGGKKLKAQRAREAQFPDEPWRWREDWAAGRIVSTNRNTMIGAWIFAILWNGVASMVWFFLPDELAKGNQLALIGLIFPFVGFGLLAWAIRAAVRWRKYGVVTFEPTTLPVPLGGELSGLITIGGPLSGVRTVRLQLLSVRRERRGKNSFDQLLWEDGKQLDAAAIHAASGIPVYFKLPRDGAPTSWKDEDNPVTWRLEVQAETAGVDFGAVFDLPVFGVAELGTAAVEDPTAVWQPNSGQAAPSPQSRIRIQYTLQGEKEFVFPPARNPGPAIFLTLFALIWTGAIWLTIAKKTPIIFPIVLGAFDALFVVLVFAMWFGSCRLVVGAHGIHVRKRWLLFQSHQKFIREEIKDIVLHIGMTSGTRAYYDLRVLTVFGRGRTIATSIADKREAEWLAQEMKAALGLKDETAVADRA
jgi:hypothetical protein